MTAGRNSTVSRRTFLQGAGAAGAGALLLSSSARARQSQQVLPQRTFGKTKQQVSILALGTWPCGKSSEVDIPAVTKLVQESLELGITFIDTAGVYGKAEEAIGIGLEGRRDGVFLASKVWANTADEAEESLTSSLKKLRTDHIDLVYAHNDPAAHGAYLAARAAGREREMKFVGIDALPQEGQMYVRQGILAASFEYPTGGAQAIETALKILAGDSVPKEITLPSRVYTQENIKAGGEILP